MSEDSARLRLRGAEGRVVDSLMDFTVKTWGKPLIAHAWEDFWVYDDVPEVMPSTPEFDTMFMPWLVLGFVPIPKATKRVTIGRRDRSVWNGSRSRARTSRTWIARTSKPPVGARSARWSSNR